MEKALNPPDMSEEIQNNNDFENEIINNTELLKLFYEYFVIHALIAEKNSFTNYFYIFLSNNFDKIDNKKYTDFISWIIGWEKSDSGSDSFDWLIWWSNFAMRVSYLRDNKWLLGKILNSNTNQANWIEQKFVEQLIIHITTIEPIIPMIWEIDQEDEWILGLFSANSNTDNFLNTINWLDAGEISQMATNHLESRKQSLGEFFTSIKGLDKKEIEIKIAIFRISDIIISKLHEICKNDINQEDQNIIKSAIENTLRNKLSWDINPKQIQEWQKRLIEHISSKSPEAIEEEINLEDLNASIDWLLNEWMSHFWG